MHSLRLYGERLYEENWDVLILEKDCCSVLPHKFALRLINLSCAIVALRGPGITRPWVGQHCLPTLVYLLLNSFIRVGVVFMLGKWGGGLFHIFVGSIRHCELRYYPNFILASHCIFVVCRLVYGSVVIMDLYSCWYPRKVNLHTLRCRNSQETQHHVPVLMV